MRCLITSLRPSHQIFLQVLFSELHLRFLVAENDSNHRMLFDLCWETMGTSEDALLVVSMAIASVDSESLN